MNQERLLLKGQLSSYQTEKRNLELQASGLISMMRMALNPYEEDLSRIPAREILAHAEQLQAVIERLQNVTERIHQLEDALNG